MPTPKASIARLDQYLSVLDLTAFDYLVLGEENNNWYEEPLILDELYEFAFRPEFQYHHDWRPGDLVMWDNRCTMHRADPEFDQRERRIMHRVLIEGDTPY